MITHAVVVIIVDVFYGVRTLPGLLASLPWGELAATVTGITSALYVLIHPFRRSHS